MRPRDGRGRPRQETPRHHVDRLDQPTVARRRVVRTVRLRFPNGHEAVFPIRRRGNCHGPGCNRPLIGRRPQTRYCGPRCRVAAHRARQANARALKPLQAPPAGENTRPTGVTVSWTALVAEQLGDDGWRTP